MLKKYSPKAKSRLCLKCGKNFKPMTDKLWEFNFATHLRHSKRHRRYKKQ